MKMKKGLSSSVILMFIFMLVFSAIGIVFISNNETISTVLDSIHWNDILDKPTLFNTGWNLILNKPNLVINSTNNYFLGKVDYSQILNKPNLVINSTNNYFLGKVDYSQILDKPSNFPTSSCYISDWGTYINQAVLTTSNPTFNILTLNKLNFGFCDLIKFSGGINYDTYLGLVSGSDYFRIFISYGSENDKISRFAFTSNGILLPDSLFTSGQIEFKNTGDPNEILLNFPLVTQTLSIRPYGNAVLGIYSDQINNYIMRLQGNGDVIVHGTLSTGGGIVTKYMNGDYDATWSSISLPSGINGMQVVAYNSNTLIQSSRLYIYTDNSWHYINIT